MSEVGKENWGKGALYERYMARWSRRIAPGFLDWLAVAEDLRWLDVGCGTGVLSEVVEQRRRPRQLVGVDLSEDFAEYAAHSLPKAHLATAVAGALPFPAQSFDVVVSALMLNFVPDVAQALDEMKRVVVSGGSVGLYVWDYAEKMGTLRLFFDAAIAVKPDAVHHDEGVRFPICRPEPLHAHFELAGLTQVEVTPIETIAHFANFDDYWQPFVSGGGFPAALYLMAQSSDDREAIRSEMLKRIDLQADGSFDLTLRAWACKGRA